MNSPNNLLISLREPLALIHDAFRVVAIELVISPIKSNRSIDRLIKYDFVPYLTALLKEMFQSMEVNHETSESVNILISDGLHRFTAQALNSEVQDLIIAEIARHFPEATRANFNCDIVEGGLLFITKLVPSDEQEEE